MESLLLYLLPLCVWNLVDSSFYVVLLWAFKTVAVVHIMLHTFLVCTNVVL